MKRISLFESKNPEMPKEAEKFKSNYQGLKSLIDKKTTEEIKCHVFKFDDDGQLESFLADVGGNRLQGEENIVILCDGYEGSTESLRLKDINENQSASERLSGLKKHLASGGKVIWNDPDHIDGNDYTVTSIHVDDEDIDEDTPILISYGGGSEAEVFLHELSMGDVNEFSLSKKSAQIRKNRKKLGKVNEEEHKGLASVVLCVDEVILFKTVVETNDKDQIVSHILSSDLIDHIVSEDDKFTWSTDKNYEKGEISAASGEYVELFVSPFSFGEDIWFPGYDTIEHS